MSLRTTAPLFVLVVLAVLAVLLLQRQDVMPPKRMQEIADPATAIDPRARAAEGMGTVERAAVPAPGAIDSPGGVEGSIVVTGTVGGSVQVRAGELSVHARGIALGARVAVEVPGDFVLPAWEGPDQVQIVLRGQEFAPVVLWCLRGDKGVRIEVPGWSKAHIRWSRPAADQPDARIHATLARADDPRSEDKDTSVSAFFDAVLRAAGHATAPLFDTTLDGVLVSGDFLYEVGPLEPGPYLLTLRNADTWWCKRIQVEAAGLDLGRIEFRAACKRVGCFRMGTDQLVPEATALLKLDLWHTGVTITSDRGHFLLPEFDAGTCTFRAEGHLDTTRKVATLGERVELAPCEPVSLSGKPGDFALALSGGQWSAAEFAADGAAKLAVGQEAEVLFYAPVAAAFEARRLSRGKLPDGPASVALEVTCGGLPLRRGSLEVMVDQQVVVTASIVDGRVSCGRLPEGDCTMTVRVGSQVHDNDHEYRFSRLKLAPGPNSFQFDLPAHKLTLAVHAANGTPSHGDRISIVARGNAPDGAFTFSIRSSGATRDGRIEFDALPDVPISVRFQRSEISVLRPGAPHQLTLP